MKNLEKFFNQTEDLAQTPDFIFFMRTSILPITLIMEENKFYLTKEGLEKVEKERQRLIEFKKLKTRGEAPSIWHSEDVNPEYLAFQEDMSLLDARIAEHTHILKNAELIKPPRKEERRAIQLGATVKLKIEGEIDEFTIVGTMEANPSLKKISNDSPIGKALLGAKVGDTVVAKASLANHHCQILNIRYDL